MKIKEIFFKGIVAVLLLLSIGILSVLTACYNTPVHQNVTEQYTTANQYTSKAETDNSTNETQVEVSSSTQSITEPEANTETDTITPTDIDVDSPTDTPSTNKQSSEKTETDISLNPGTVTPPSDGIKRIAFTFDDGPHWEYTKLIADEFQKYGGKCTYFVVGNRVHGQQKEALSYVASIGNEIGIHGYTHTKYYNKCAEADYLYELQATHDIILSATQISPVLMRPPGGSISNSRVVSSPYSVILWNVDTKDWSYKKNTTENINIIVSNILNNTTDGDIILMHDIYKNTYEAVKIALPILKEQGYEFVTVSELLGEERQTGTKYNSAY